jgi:hypothetical protein
MSTLPTKLRNLSVFMVTGRRCQRRGRCLDTAIQPWHDFGDSLPGSLTPRAKNAHSPLKGPTPNLSNSQRTLQQPWWTRCGEKCFPGFDLYQNTNAFVLQCKPNAFVNYPLGRDRIYSHPQGDFSQWTFHEYSTSLKVLTASITRSHPESSPHSARRCVWNRGFECSISAAVRGRCCAPGHAITASSAPASTHATRASRVFRPPWLRCR